MESIKQQTWLHDGESCSPNVRELVSNNTAFALDLYRYLFSQAESENLFFSPYSISAALAMTYAGAREKTAKEMAEVLKFSLESEGLHSAFAELRSMLTVDATENYKFTVVNQIWGQTGYPFLESFLELLQNHYGASLETVDFAGDLETARQTINSWVEQKTNGKIKDLLSPGILTELTRLVLTNAVYFKAKWAEPFPPYATEEEPFEIAPDRYISVPMMKGRTYESKYVALDDVELLELFYFWESLRQSMVIILPERADGLTQLAKQLTPSKLEEWLAALDNNRPEGKLETWLPKFKVSSAFDLKQTLTELGMPSAFIYRIANFSGMDGDVQLPLYLQAVVHKAFVDVNESGTEAAAATAGVVGTRGIVRHRGPIVVNRPFLLLIRDLTSNSILFIGQVVNPLSETDL